MKSKTKRPITVKEAHNIEKRTKLNTPIFKQVKKNGTTKFVARNHVISYLCPNSIVLPKSIVDAVKRGLKSKPLRNAKTNTKSHKKSDQSCKGQLIHLHKGEIILPPKYGKILERVVNTPSS